MWPYVFVVDFFADMDLSDPRTRQRVAVEADVCLPTLMRFVKGGEAAVRPSSVRRIRDALASLEKREAQP